MVLILSGLVGKCFPIIWTMTHVVTCLLVILPLKVTVMFLVLCYHLKVSYRWNLVMLISCSKQTKSFVECTIAVHCIYRFTDILKLQLLLLKISSETGFDGVCHQNRTQYDYDHEFSITRFLTKLTFKRCQMGEQMILKPQFFVLKLWHLTTKTRKYKYHYKCLQIRKHGLDSWIDRSGSLFEEIVESSKYTIGSVIKVSWTYFAMESHRKPEQS